MEYSLLLELESCSEMLGDLAGVVAGGVRAGDKNAKGVRT